MIRSWVYTILSSITLLIASTLLVTFVKMYTIPHELTNMFQPSTCKVIKIICTDMDINNNYDTEDIDVNKTKESIVVYGARLEISEQVNPVIELLLLNNLSLFHNPADTKKNSSNISNIVYNITQRHNQSGDNTGNSKHVKGYNIYELNDNTNQSNKGSNCDCVSVLVDIIHDNVVNHVPLIQDSWVYYKMMSTDPLKQCSCPDCKLDPNNADNVYINKRPLTVGDAIPCHINIDTTDEILLQKLSTAFVLNIMLWPTLLFMVGFVGLFFSCLYLQYEQCDSICLNL